MPRNVALGLRRPQATAIGVALVAVLFGVYAVLGFVAPGKGFDWNVAAVGGTAVGTTLLAVGTLALAYSTWQDVRASQHIAENTTRSLDLAEREREDRLRPLVIGTVTGLVAEGGHGHLNAELRNVGGGAAVDVEVGAEYDGPAGRVQLEPKRLAGLTASETFPVAIDFRRITMEGQLEVELFRITGRYRDRLFRRVPLPVIDWQRDTIPDSGYPDVGAPKTR